MVDQIRQIRSYDPDLDEFEEDSATSHPSQYRFGRSARDYQPDPSIPLFLSDPDGEPDPREFIVPMRKSRIASVSSRILMAVVAAAGLAMLFAWFSSDATRDIIVNAKASIATVLPVPSVAAQPESVQLTPNDMQLKDPARVGAPAPQVAVAAVAAAPSSPVPVLSNPSASPFSANAAPARANSAGPVVASVSPSREDISTAYQSALQGHPAVAAAPQIVTPPPARRIDAQELATLMKRAKDLLAAGDIPSARLLLERAADSQEPTAALMLARTYDPDVLGTNDVRNINADPTIARAWYQKAAQFGSAEAQRRLAQMTN